MITQLTPLNTLLIRCCTPLTINFIIHLFYRHKETQNNTLHINKKCATKTTMKSEATKLPGSKKSPRSNLTVTRYYDNK